MGNESQTKTNLNDLKKEVDTDAHTLPLDEFYTKYDTNPRYGLTHEEAAKRLEKYGPNVLSPPKQRPMWLKFLLSFTDGFSIILILGGLMCYIAFTITYFTKAEAPKDNLYIGTVLLAVVIITGSVGFYQNNRSEQIMDSFKKLIPQESLVIRSGEKTALSAKDIVIGDLVLLKSGDFVPADIRVLEANTLKVDNSSLTGESEPQKRHAQCTHENPLETANFLISYTYVVDGTGSGIVVFTGDETIMGRIAYLTSSLAQGKTPIAIEIDHFIKIITIIAVTLGVVLFLLSIIVIRLDIVSAVVFLIGVIIANVPEGLIITVTLALSLTAKNMAKKNCLVKNLNSVETLGSTGVICSDKTGTLTQNQMLVSHLWCNKTTLTIVQDEEPEPTYKDSENDVHSAITRCAAICNRAEFRHNQAKDLALVARRTTGDASESALIKYVEKFSKPIKTFREEHPKVFEIPFNSTNKYQVSVHEVDGESRYLLVMKGAPERILERCSTYLMTTGEMLVDEEFIACTNEENESLAALGERVLGFAQLWLSEDDFARGCQFTKDDEPVIPLEGLCFLGLITLIDPPRTAVPGAVASCRSAGIRVVMVTGDHPATAKAIARNVGIINLSSLTADEVMKKNNIPMEKVEPGMAKAIVVTGSELKNMSQEQLDSIIVTYEDIVFARTSPQQKLIIVEAFQRQGYIVAVTGDGVNDSPALRKADIGVAMGIAGSDVAKQAADMILLDDNFATIVLGVKQGRLIFDNLKKSIAYTLTSNIPEILPFLLQIFLGIPLPLATIPLLMIDLGTDMAPAISLAYEKAERDIMERKPRNPKKDRLVNAVLIDYAYLLVGVMQALNGMITYFFIMLFNGFLFKDLTVGSSWDDRSIPFIVDSFGQEWSYVARKNLEFTCQTAYFAVTVIIQIANVLTSRTRRLSIFQQGLFANKHLLLAILFEVGLACVIIYVKPINVGLNTRFVEPIYFVIAVINSVILWGIDEIRRLIIRRYPGGFIEKETYY